MNSAPLCGICFKKYDLAEHIPVTPSQCNHTICQYCADKILQSKNRSCPHCRKPFSCLLDTPKYLVNLEMRRIVEYNSKFEFCQKHDKPLDLYCETDQCKICYDCQYRDGETGHRGHFIDHLEKLQKQVSERKKLYEKGQEKLKAAENQVKEFIGTRMSENRRNLEDIDRITKLSILEKKIRVNETSYQEKAKSEEQFSKSPFFKEINERLEQCDKKDSFRVILKHDVKSFNDRLANATSDQLIQGWNKRIDQAMISLEKQNYSITPSGLNVVFSHPLAKFRIFSERMTLARIGDLIDVKISRVLQPQTSFEVDVDSWEKIVKSIKITIEEFDEYDLEVLEYVYMRLEKQIQSVSLTYRNIKTQDVQLQNKFEDHIARFSRLVFSSIQTLSSLELKFIKSNGSDRFMRALQEALLSRGSSLTSLKIHCDKTDLTKETIANFFRSAGDNDLLKSLRELYLAFNDANDYFHGVQGLSLELPNLKSFIFNADCHTPAMTDFLLSRKLLESMKEQLETYEVQLGSKFKEDEDYEEDEEEGKEGENFYKYQNSWFSKMKFALKGIFQSIFQKKFAVLKGFTLQHYIIDTLMDFKKIVSIKITIPMETPGIDIIMPKDFISPSIIPEGFATPFIQYVEINNNILIDINDKI